jgi:hypothetical protein
VLDGAGDLDGALIDGALIDGALIDGALSGTVCHDVPIRRGKQLAHAQLVHRLVSPWWPAAISSWSS